MTSGNYVLYRDDENRQKHESWLMANARESGARNPRIVWDDEARGIFHCWNKELKVCGWVDE